MMSESTLYPQTATLSEMSCGGREWSTDCVSLECLDGSVLSQFTDMNTHVCATRGKCVVALPVHIQSWSWGEQEHREYPVTHVDWLTGPEDKDTCLYLSGRGTVAWLLPCEHPIWWLSGETFNAVKRQKIIKPQTITCTPLTANHIHSK